MSDVRVNVRIRFAIAWTSLDKVVGSSSWDGWIRSSYFPRQTGHIEHIRSTVMYPGAGATRSARSPGWTASAPRRFGHLLMSFDVVARPICAVFSSNESECLVAISGSLIPVPCRLDVTQPRSDYCCHCDTMLYIIIIIYRANVVDSNKQYRSN